MRVTLERVAYLPGGTYGRLRFNGFEAWTVEAPWRDNVRGRSCIPEGDYSISLGHYYRGGYPTWEVDGVPGRSLIKFHRANVPSDLKGCIAPVLSLGVLLGEFGGFDSKRAHTRLMAHLDGLERARLLIRQAESPCPSPVLPDRAYLL